MNKTSIYLILAGIFFLQLAGIQSLHAQYRPREESGTRVTGWMDDTHFIFQTTDKDKKPVTQSVNIKTGESVLITPEKSDREKIQSALPPGFQLNREDVISPDGQSAVMMSKNNLYFFKPGDTCLTQLTRDTIPEMNFRFSPDGKRIAYTRNKDLYVLDLVSHKELRLTFDASEKVYNGWSSWVYMEEILRRESRYAAFWWSPDGARLAFFRFDDSAVPLFTLNRLDETDGVHGTLEATPYPKPGDPNPKVKLGIADVAKGRIVWVKTDYSADQYLGWPFWTPDSKKITVQVLNRDQNEMRFLLADAVTGDCTEIYKETSNTWMDFFEDAYVMKNGSGFILKSYRNGWKNLYYLGWDGTLKSQLTNAGWNVNKISRVDEEDGLVYFTGTGPESTDNHAFRVGLDGKDLLQMTGGNGNHEVQISPKGSYFIDTWNSVESAGSIIAIDKKGKRVREIHRFDQPLSDPAKYSKTELVKIPTSDGLFNMPALITYPLNFDGSKKYPVVFNIYGGPDMGRVFNTWQGSSPSWYAQNGIITINVDHRGSGKFGRKGLDFVFRCLGKWEISDYSDAVKWLKEKPYVDPDKIGITGSSYGGYVTCMALTKGAGYWTHGVAASSVTDWRLYDSFYTEKYMDIPGKNPDGYREGSATSYVKDFKGKLLITHGDIDNNVHMQNSIRLISALEDAGKSFEFMLYPDGRHGWGGAKRNHSVSEAHRFWLENFFGK